MVEEMVNPKADLGQQSSSADSLPLLVNDGDGDAIAALAFIVGRIDADPTASLQGSLGDWAQWLEDEGYNVSSLVALFEQLVRSQAESAPAASELVASLAPDQALNAVIRRLHDGAPTLLDAVFAHLDHGADLHARLLGLSGGSMMKSNPISSLRKSIHTVTQIHRKIDKGLDALESGILLDLLPDQGGLLDQVDRNILSDPVFYVKEQNSRGAGGIDGAQYAYRFGVRESRVDVGFDRGREDLLVNLSIETPKRSLTWQPGHDLVIDTPKVSFSWERIPEKNDLYKDQLDISTINRSVFWEQGQGGEIELPHLSVTWNYWYSGFDVDVPDMPNVGIILYPFTGNAGHHGVNFWNESYYFTAAFSNGRSGGVSGVLFDTNNEYSYSWAPGSSLEITNITYD